MFLFQLVQVISIILMAIMAIPSDRAILLVISPDIVNSSFLVLTNKAKKVMVMADTTIAMLQRMKNMLNTLRERENPLIG